MGYERDVDAFSHKTSVTFAFEAKPKGCTLVSLYVHKYFFIPHTDHNGREVYVFVVF